MNKETNLIDLNIFINKITDFLLNELVNIIMIFLIYLLVSWLLNKIYRRLSNKLDSRYDDSGNLEGRKRMITLVRLIKSLIRIGLISILLLVLFSELIRERGGYRYMEELGTEPRVWYLPPRDRIFPVERGLESLDEAIKERYKDFLGDS